MPNKLWSYQMTFRTSTVETSFALTFGMEAVILAEVEVPSHRTMCFSEHKNDRALALGLDLLEENRFEADFKNAIYKQRSKRYYSLCPP